MDKDNDRVLGLDSLDFMKDNGEEFFLASEDRATYDELEEVNPSLEEFTFEDLEIEVINELNTILAEYERYLKELEKSEEKNDLPLDKG